MSLEEKEKRRTGVCGRGEKCRSELKRNPQVTGKLDMGLRSIASVSLCQLLPFCDATNSLRNRLAEHSLLL